MGKCIVRNLVLGAIGTNCYLIENKETKEILIVDPADHASRIQDAISMKGGKPVAILLTHGHFDHILACEDLRDLYEIPVYAHEAEAEVLADPMMNLSGAWASSYTMKADVLVKDGQELELAGCKIQVLHTPGHTKGGCCYYFPEEEALFSGDTLFCRSYGRVDFPTSSPRQMQDSVKRLLTTLPEETDVYPGHESFTSIGMEKRYNPLA